jgi:hypothetical protein
MITDHAIDLIAERGLGGVNFVTLADRIGYSPQAIQKWVGTSVELMVVVTATFGQRWQHWVTRRRYEQGTLGLLPANDEEGPWTRVLLALEEHGRAERQRPELPLIFADLRACERWVLTSVHPGLDDPERAGAVDRLLVVVDGLRAALSRPHEPLSPDGARDILAAECRDRAGALAAWLSPRSCDVMGLDRLVGTNQPT